MIKIDENLTVTSPVGFKASGIHCGLKKSLLKKDLALIYSDVVATSCGVYTKNKVKGAPLTITKQHLINKKAQAIIINSGNANTCNGDDGLSKAKKMTHLCAKALSMKNDDVLVASTGVIGVPLNIDAIKNGIPQLVGNLSSDIEGAKNASMAIMTTDTVEKQAGIQLNIGGKKVTLAAMAKGSGMIHPNMATMLFFITTDISISPSLLKEALKGEKVVLIENEFGEIGIDGGFLKDAGIEVTEMNSGCICCSLVGDFGSALKEVVTQYNPDRIIIEPSGVGKLSDVIKAVQGVAEDVELDLNSFVTVADAKKCKMYIKNFGEFYNNQVEYAGSIILSRTGDVAEDKLNESVALLREHNEKAAIITTPWDELSGEQILKVMEDGNDMVKELLEEEEICPVCGGHHDHDHDHEHHHDHDHEHHHHDHDEECGCGCGHDHDHDHEHHHHDHDEECSCGCGHDHDHHHHHHADEVFTSWGKETPKKYNKEELDTILQKLSKDDSYGMILRSKGILQTEDGSWIQFDLVPGEYEIREGSADYTGRICVIGSKLKEDELEGLFF